ncbi:uncharacterized protein LOC127286273 isoform X2 [Leptopilina boulardi]|uniref:uncharacterized protein LOC127286273 isoform X2 n=1 Tax=Leptopilina boulardi TaxID=63433 RepID=UPI0021F61E0F|nr:uncharacterized protein LOC127286273 isoform X2 [Leptopilina boulardi]
MDNQNFKRKRNNEIPEERLLKKFQYVEEKLLQLWETDSNIESTGSVNAASDIISFVDNDLEQEFDDESENYNNNEDEDNYHQDSIIEEIPPEIEPIEEIDLSDDELAKIWENGENSPKPPDDEDVVFLKEGTIKENGIPVQSCSLHPDIRETWTVWTRAGIPFKDREELQKKYPPPKFLSTPQINPEILETLHKRPIEKDEFIRSSQELVGSALTALGSVMTSLLSDVEMDKLKVLNGLNDAAKILTSSFHLDTDKRRSNIISWKPKPIQKILVSTKPDEFLFGEFGFSPTQSRWSINIMISH